MNPFIRDNLRFVLRDKKILLGITGSIAAFKACDIVRYLRDCGAQVRVVLTQGAENFVTRTTLETLSGFPVMSGFWSEDQTTGGMHQGTHHIDTARWADLILVAPATAHLIAKTANGFADDLLSTEILAFQGPLLIAPAMNPAIYSHPAVQANLQTLSSRGTMILGPTHGLTSCGEEGLGRMSEPEKIVENVASRFYAPRTNKRIIVTLGPTRSAIDPVRYITNRSSGIMGAALCWSAVQKGYDVVAITGPVNVSLPESIKRISVQTANEMAEATLKEWDQADIFISTAAVLDWDIQKTAPEKLKKEQGAPKLDLKKNPDILAEISKRRRPDQYVLGFAAETENLLQNAKRKIDAKGCNAIFANDVSLSQQGFESEQNGGWWITEEGQAVEFQQRSKIELAQNLISTFP